MCIIIYKKPGIDVSQDHLENSAENNPDGFGLSYINSEGVLTVKRTLDFGEFCKIYKECLKDNPDSNFLLHFRKNTVGETTVENCHPFWVSPDMTMMHNGTIYGCVPDKTDTQETRSDSRIFAEDFLNKLPKAWEKVVELRKMVHSFIGKASKVVTMDAKGDVSIINVSAGHWEKGLWMSNYSYYPNTRSVQTFRPTQSKYYGSEIPTPPEKARFHVAMKGGQYYRKHNKISYRWDAAFEAWRPCQKNGSFIYGETLLKDVDPIKHKGNISFIIGTDDKKPRTLGTADCEWCGCFKFVDHLKVISFNNASSEADISMMCSSCIQAMKVDDVWSGGVILHKYDINILVEKQRFNNQLALENV